MDRLEQPPVRLYVAGAVIAVLAVFTGSFSYGRAQVLRREAALAAAVERVGAAGTQGTHQEAAGEGAGAAPGDAGGGGAGGTGGQAAGPGGGAGDGSAGGGLSGGGKQGSEKSASHVVRRGETLSRIARMYGVPVDSLREANGLTSDVIKPGQKLVVPGAEPLRTHVVKEGESFWQIARQYGVPLAALLDANRELDPGHLMIGEEIRIPSSRATVVAIPATNPMDEPAVEALAGKFAWPVLAPISSYFGPRWGRNHAGIDLAANHGDPIRAARDGTVVLAGEVSGYGLTVVLEHEDGTRTLYAHASELKVQPGQKVRQGDVIALVGSTGRSTGPHLHFEIIVNDQPRDPLLFLPKR